MAEKARLNQKIVSDDFPNHWGKFKPEFYEAQCKGKCAYCEVPISVSQPGDVEHFRPKARVQAMTRGNRDDRLGQPARHKRVGKEEPGYWCLGYEWKNYLLACTRCNSTWKSDQFPVDATRAVRSGQESREGALLINPFDEDPARHFEYSEVTGEIRERTPRGKACIDVYGLDRRSLDEQHLVKAAKLQRIFDQYLFALKNDNEPLRRSCLGNFLEECRPEQPFAGFARDIVQRNVKLTYEQLLRAEERGELDLG